MNTLKKTALSAMTIALYFVLMYLTQSFAFYGIQIRIATGFYALSYVFPFLTLPLGIANALSNILGGLGTLDIVGGFFAGIFTALLCALAEKLKKPILASLAILLVPSLTVSIWLSYLLSVPYHIMIVSVFSGQIVPAFFGYILIKVLDKRKVKKWIS